MISKVANILLSIAVNGFFAIFIAAFFYIILAIVFMFAMIPVSIIAGERISTNITHLVDGNLSFKIIYTVVFVSMVLDDLGIKVTYWKIKK